MDELVALLMAQNEGMTEEQAKAKATEMLKAAGGANTDLQAEVMQLRQQLQAEQGKAAGILAEKKKAQERLTAVESEIARLKQSGMSDTEKLQADLKAAQDALLDREDKIKKLQADATNAERRHQVDAIAASYQFKKDLPEGAGRLFVERAFDKVDLNDENAVKATRILFQEQHKGVLVAETPSGGATPASGGNGDIAPGGRDAANRTEEARTKEIINMSPEDRAKDLRSRKA